MDFAAHASSFGAAADLYDRIRPRYPIPALRWALGDQPLSVVDLAAGTGILTRQLIDLGHSVTAVEPDQQMRAQITSDARAGRADAIPLPSGRFDAVTAGQAYHWFADERAHVEIARVLAPGGVFVPIWNVRDESVPWVAALTELLHDRRTAEDFDERSLPGDAFGPLFGPAEVKTFPWTTTETADSLVDLVRSRSYYLVADPPQRAELERSVRDLAADHPDLAGRAEFEVPYVTYAYRASRRRVAVEDQA